MREVDEIPDDVRGAVKKVVFIQCKIGKSYEFTVGEDFTCKTVSFRSMAYNHAKAIGAKAMVRTRGNKVFVKFAERNGKP